MATHPHRSNSRPRKYYPNPRFPSENDALDLPEVYASVCFGGCLEPVFRDGTRLVFSKTDEPRAGDYVGIWFDPDIVPEGEMPRQVKRLAADLMKGVRFPYEPLPGSTVEPLVFVQMFNPPRLFQIPASKIIAMHKVIGTGVSNGNGKARLVPLTPEQKGVHHGRG